MTSGVLDDDALDAVDVVDGPEQSRLAAPGDSKRRSPRTASIAWCGVISGPLGFLIGAQALRATVATNALDHQADIAKGLQ